MQKQKVDSVIICPKCGTRHLANAKYCTKCGYIFVSPHKKIEKVSAKLEKKEEKTQKENLETKIESINTSLSNKLVCPICHTSFSSNLKRCPKCGFKI
ncbi:MAG: zinc-ribbon domain-containing protein [Candidatus Anstonellaceae archaeon]